MFDDNNNNNNKYFKVESIPGKGLGLLSTRDIAGKIINNGYFQHIPISFQLAPGCWWRAVSSLSATML